MNRESLTRLDREDRLVFVADKVYRKLYLSENSGSVAPTVWDDASNAANGADEVKALFGSQVFDTVKPLGLMERIIHLTTHDDDIVLDFFAGSGTTGHAVVKINTEDGGTRRFILVQLADVTPKASLARSEQFGTIADLARSRLKIVGERLAERQHGRIATKPTIDAGFRALRIDSTNLADVHRSPDVLPQTALTGFTETVKPGRTDEDLLFEVLIAWGLEPTLPIERERERERESLPRRQRRAHRMLQPAGVH